MMDFSKAYNRADFVNYLRRDFLPDDFEQEEKNVPFWTQMNYASVATCLGKSMKSNTIRPMMLAWDCRKMPSVCLQEKNKTELWLSSFQKTTRTITVSR